MDAKEEEEFWKEVQDYVYNAFSDSKTKKNNNLGDRVWSEFQSKKFDEYQRRLACQYYLIHFSLSSGSAGDNYVEGLKHNLGTDAHIECLTQVIVKVGTALADIDSLEQIDPQLKLSKKRSNQEIKQILRKYGYDLMQEPLVQDTQYIKQELIR